MHYPQANLTFKDNLSVKLGSSLFFVSLQKNCEPPMPEAEVG
jgi:hypothetical protein